MASKVSLNKCWGCGKEEDKQNNVTLRTCSKCIQLKIVPLLFCSDECLNESWPRHKELHKTVKQSRGGISALQATEDEVKEMKRCSKTRKKAEKSGSPMPGFNYRGKNGDKYEKILYEAQSKMMKMNFSGAKKKFLEAINLDVRLPEAYGGLGTSLMGSGQRKEAYSYIEQALERWAYVILTGKLGDEMISKKRRDDWAFSHWALLIQCLLEDLMQPANTSFPINESKFYCQDSIMKIVTKVLLQYFKGRTKSQNELDCEMYSLQLLTNFHAFALSRIFSAGRFNLDLDGTSMNIPADTPLDDIEAASKLLREAAEIKIENFIPGRLLNQPEILRLIADQLTENRAARVLHSRPTDPCNSPPSYYVGCWVIVHGLQSEAGQRLNRKLGMVAKVRDRLAVQIGGIGEDPKSVRPQNCYIIPMADKEIALVACLSDSSKWDYLQPKVQGYLAGMPS